MHFLIVGPGAMGCLFASRLKRAGYAVTLLDYIRERAEKRDREEANAWMLQMVLTLSLSAAAIFGVYWFTFVKSPKIR